MFSDERFPEINGHSIFYNGASGWVAVLDFLQATLGQSFSRYRGCWWNAKLQCGPVFYFFKDERFVYVRTFATILPRPRGPRFDLSRTVNAISQISRDRKRSNLSNLEYFRSRSAKNKGSSRRPRALSRSTHLTIQTLHFFILYFRLPLISRYFVAVSDSFTNNLGNRVLDDCDIMRGLSSVEASRTQNQRQRSSWPFLFYRG